MRTRETYALHLTPVPGHWLTPPLQRLRHALKAFLRAYGLRCTQLRYGVPPSGGSSPRPTAAAAARHFAQMRLAADQGEKALLAIFFYFLLSTFCFSSTWYYAVTACDRYGCESDYSGEITYPRATNITAITLAWDPSPDPDVIAYHVYAGAGTRDYHRMATATTNQYTWCFTNAAGVRLIRTNLVITVVDPSLPNGALSLTNPVDAVGAPHFFTNCTISAAYK